MAKEKKKAKYFARDTSLLQPPRRNAEVLVCGDIQLHSEVLRIDSLVEVLKDLLADEKVHAYLFETEKKKIRGGLGVG